MCTLKKTFIKFNLYDVEVGRKLLPRPVHAVGIEFEFFIVNNIIVSNIARPSKCSEV